ncbi:hypothetical protein WR164_13380 [Philodulcilactobacillus myokoensis]|uniref:Uncharacterized protein n=1 Tax=Philodulcilactobacillus myokoensis TaxID=2929573 RepID=A0A9W6B1T0_9LACO|nr:hypothetical protein [Philodulcilactobacillus myokoensis]GLB47359.1 hypothetical protein WR164_13380 [Philodulcilactobacillus myokoensis]
MQINIKNFISEITDEKFQKQSQSTTKGNLTKHFNATIKSAVNFIVQNIKKNQIAQAELVTKRPETSIRLELNVINLPLRYAKNIGKVTKDDANYDLNVYMVIESPDVNRSKLRIDELASADDFNQNPDQYLPKFKAWVNNQFEQIDDNKQSGSKKETQKATSNKKTSTKKKTTKK